MHFRGEQLQGTALVMQQISADPLGLLTKVVGLTWSAVGVLHEAAGWRDAFSRTIARDNPGDVDGHPG